MSVNLKAGLLTIGLVSAFALFGWLAVATKGLFVLAAVAVVVVISIFGFFRAVLTERKPDDYQGY